MGRPASDRASSLQHPVRDWNKAASFTKLVIQQHTDLREPIWAHSQARSTSGTFGGDIASH